MKTTLCLMCTYGLVREEDCGDEKCTEQHFVNKCLLGGDYPGNIITLCNRYEKAENKITYHDPEFTKYLDKVLREYEEENKVYSEEKAINRKTLMENSAPSKPTLAFEEGGEDDAKGE